MDNLRPSPEALLERAQHETKGRLKIFFGAAPGVGKTYEMLLAARARRAAGVDVVAGVVETHGRKETEALLADLEVIPRRTVEYKDRYLTEMDLDALLTRRPEIAIVDELAHTNAPGSRHPKRYLDVIELLEAGIDVYTTLNIQHVESLNDVVAQITRIRVRETVPDSIVDRADEIELVDITPEELIDRLQAGKVYVPDTAQRAIRHYFSPGNLTALRELALRRTAQRVDEQLLSHMQAHAIRGPWAAGARVLVCVSEDPRSPGLVRHARRLADHLHAPWTALYVETSRHHRLTDAERDRVTDCLRLADRLGGQALTHPGADTASEVLAYAQANNITHIVVGKSSRSRWFEMLHGSVVHDLVRHAGNISVLVMAGDDEEPVHEKATKIRERTKPLNPIPYAMASGIMLIAVGAGVILQQFLHITSVALLLLSAVVLVAARQGLWPSLFASGIAFLAFNFIFVEPLYTFTIAHPENVVALFFFLISSVFVSNLAAQTRAEVLIARRRARIAAELYSFSQKLAGIIDLDDLLWATTYQIALMLKVRVVLLLPEGDQVIVRAGFPPEDELDDADLAAARWSWEHDEPAGRSAETLPGGKRLFLPLRTGRGAVGIIGIDRDEPGPLFSPEERRLLEALLDQAAVAIERIHLANDADRAQVVAQTQRLHSALLSSISHDLRTPLASILGAVTSLRSYGDSYDPASRDELIGTIEEEAERLNRFVANLLDVTRLEVGRLDVRKELNDVEEIVGSALQRAGKVLADHRLEVDLSSDLPMLSLDGVLLEQAIFNLLDNAAKYAPAGSTVSVRAYRQDEQTVIEVSDEGPGIPLDDLEHIFDKFYRIATADRKRAGTGLGLSISRGFVETMGGQLRASNRTDRSGTVFTITFPAADEEASKEMDGR
ncbi:MAG: ATP-binding protein [Hyphomicrobium sp.]